MIPVTTTVCYPVETTKKLWSKWCQFQFHLKAGLRSFCGVKVGESCYFSTSYQWLDGMTCHVTTDGQWKAPDKCHVTDDRDHIKQVGRVFSQHISRRSQALCSKPSRFPSKFSNKFAMAGRDAADNQLKSFHESRQVPHVLNRIIFVFVDPLRSLVHSGFFFELDGLERR